MAEADDLLSWWHASIDHWNAGDIEAVVADGTIDGFGFRSRDARVGLTPEVQGAVLQGWYDSLERYRIKDVDVDCRIDGDTTVLYGFFTEDFQHAGGPPERLRVRFTHVLTRRDGGWEVVWQHRDIQEFTDGFYVPQPAD